MEEKIKKSLILPNPVISTISLYYNCGRKNKEIVDITGLGKGTVSKCIKIDIDDYIEDCIKRAGFKKD